MLESSEKVSSQTGCTLRSDTGRKCSTGQSPHFFDPSPRAHGCWSRRAQEKKINELKHFTTLLPQVDGSALKFHLIHEPSSNKKAIPLLLLHGWPVRRISSYDCSRLFFVAAGKFPRVCRPHQAAQEKSTILDCRPVSPRLRILRRTAAQQEDRRCRDV